MMLAEKKLACAVIGKCVDDFTGSNLESDYLFLSGQTEIGAFWFSVAGLEPLRMEREKLFITLRNNAGRGVFLANQ